MVRSTVTNAQGLKLSCYTFSAVKPVATIIFHHGYAQPGRFEFLRASQRGGPHDSYDGSFIQIMRDHGLTVVVMDMQGMGDSERVRPKVSAYFERFDQCADELNPRLGYDLVYSANPRSNGLFIHDVFPYTVHTAWPVICWL